MSGSHLDFNIYGYEPSLAAGVIFLVAFSLITLFQIGRIFRSRVWWMVVLVLGGFLETLGWVGRTWAAINVYNLNAFMTQQVCLILAPCFYSATVYALLGVIIRSVGRRYSLLPANAYLWIFCIADIVSIAVQGAGGGISAGALADDKSSRSGANIMLAGIVLQLFFMIVFAGLAIDVWMRLRKDQSYRALVHPQDGNLTRLAWGIGVATVMIIIRGGYRTGELAEGWGGYLLTHEPYFCVLDSALMVICQGVFCFVWPKRGNSTPATTGDTTLPLASEPSRGSSWADKEAARSGETVIAAAPSHEKLAAV